MNILLQNVNIGKPWGWGGIESHSGALAAVLAGRGHKVVMGCWVEGTIPVTGGVAVPARRIPVRNSGDLRAIVRMATVCRKEEIEIVIANGGREYWPASIAAGLSGARTVFIRHQTDRLKFTTRWLINNHIDRIVAVSHPVRESLLRSGIDERKITVIHNCVHVGRFDPALVSKDAAREQIGTGKQDMVVGTVAKLHRGKGVYEILGAFVQLARRYPLLKLLFVGDGPERNGLEKEARRLNLDDRAIFTGVMKDIEQMYAAMDIFVLPSTCEEAFGMVLIEAMAMGKPVIGTTVGGIPDIVKDGVNGLLVPPGDVGALSGAIERYLEDPVFAETVAREGRRTVEEEFSEIVMGERFEELLHGLGLS